MKKILLKEIAKENAQSFKISGKDFINYLDTSSITENKISNIQKLYPSHDIIPSRARRAVKENTIVYSSVRPNLKHFGIIEKPLKNMVVSTGFITLDIIDSTQYNPKYIYYNLSQQKNTNYLDTIARTNVSAYPGINDTDLLNLEILVFDNIDKQMRIANILSSLDDKIELNNKVNKELEKIAKTLYEYWFVQFDFPDENKRPYKSSGGKMVYNEVLKREIPVEWKIDNFRNHATIASGFSFNSDDYVKDGIWKIVTIKNVQQGYLDRSSIDTIAQIPNKMPDFVKLKPGDILISLTGNIGRMCMVDGDHFLLNQRVGKILSNKDFLLFAYLLLSDDKNQIRLKRISSGSSQQNLSPIQAVDFMFTLPNANILGQFNAQIEPLYNQILILKQQSEILKTLRDFLLPMLMNGQVSVKS